jgi:hypothetical protein
MDDNQASTIRDVAERILALKAQRKTISEDITEERGRIKALGIRMADFNAVFRLWELEAEERDGAIDGIRTCFVALEIGDQGDLFPGLRVVAGGDESDDDAPARKSGGHRYPKSKFAGGATGDVLSEVFSDAEAAE